MFDPLSELAPAPTASIEVRLRWLRQFAQVSIPEVAAAADIEPDIYARFEAGRYARTALYDTVVALALHMKQETTLQKRALLIVTDGGDNASQDTLEEALQELQQKDTPVVYVIALTSPTKRTTSTVRALESLSQKTGGAAYFPADVQEVDSITREIASAIRSQFVIGYKSSSIATGHKFHGIEVQAYDPNRRKLRVQTRNGYYSDSKGGA